MSIAAFDISSEVAGLLPPHLQFLVPVAMWSCTGLVFICGLICFLRCRHSRPRNKCDKTSLPASEPTEEETTPEPASEPTEEETTPEPASEPTEEETTPEPPSEPTKEETTPEPPSEPTKEGTTPEPASEPTEEETASEPASEPTKEGTTPESASEPTEEETASEPASEPTKEETASEPHKQPILQFTGQDGSVTVRFAMDMGRASLTPASAEARYAERDQFRVIPRDGNWYIAPCPGETRNFTTINGSTLSSERMLAEGDVVCLTGKKSGRTAMSLSVSFI